MVAAMANQKDLKFVEFILEETEAGKIEWENTADEDKFVASLRGKYKVTVDREFEEDGEIYHFWLTLLDDSDRELLKIYDSASPLVTTLFYLAQRKSLNVDAVLDEIMSGDEDDTPRSGTKITDEDIPF